jgi:hypothetical protein
VSGAASVFAVAPFGDVVGTSPQMYRRQFHLREPAQFAPAASRAARAPLRRLDLEIERLARKA